MSIAGKLNSPCLALDAGGDSGILKGGPRKSCWGRGELSEHTGFFHPPEILQNVDLSAVPSRECWLCPPC